MNCIVVLANPTAVSHFCSQSHKAIAASSSPLRACTQAGQSPEWIYASSWDSFPNEKLYGAGGGQFTPGAAGHGMTSCLQPTGA